MRMKPTEFVKTDLRCIEPDAYAAAAATGQAIDTKGFEYALFIVSVGTLGTSATVDCKIQDCATSGGIYADISGATITQFVKATDDDAAPRSILVRCAEQARYLKAVMTVGAAASDAGVSVVLFNPVVLPTT